MQVVSKSNRFRMMQSISQLRRSLRRSQSCWRNFTVAGPCTLYSAINACCNSLGLYLVFYAASALHCLDNADSGSVENICFVSQFMARWWLELGAPCLNTRYRRHLRRCVFILSLYASVRPSDRPSMIMFRQCLRCTLTNFLLRTLVGTSSCDWVLRWKSQRSWSRCDQICKKNTISGLCFRDISSMRWWIFRRFLPIVHPGTKIVLRSQVQRSRSQWAQSQRTLRCAPISDRLVTYLNVLLISGRV